jgi:predicted O-methyltransferase YrrM
VNQSFEQQMPTEFLHKNQEAMNAYFGSFFQLMRQSLVSGGSELGLGMTLFSLAVSIRASTIIEIGRFKGFSTLCLASALRFLEIGWQEPRQHKQRPDINYDAFENPNSRRLISIDLFPTEEAIKLIQEANLTQYVEFVNQRSDEFEFSGEADLIFIDGDHSYEGCKEDVYKYVFWNLRQGGYFVLHDYFGWYDNEGRNNSPIKMVTDEILEEGIFQHILIDTGYQSFVVFKNSESR